MPPEVRLSNLLKALKQRILQKHFACNVQSVVCTHLEFQFETCNGGLATTHGLFQHVNMLE